LKTLRTLITVNLGVCLEGFDFIVYSAFAAVLGREYFPATDRWVTESLVFAGFGVAYVIRPAGGWYWGVYADRRGRRPALARIAVLTGFGTALIAVAPPYAVIGLMAPVLVLIGRVIQGFAASGEFASATAMLAEAAPPGRRSLFAGTQMAAQILTVSLATATVLLLSTALDPSAVQRWGWRCAFGLGALIAPLGFYMRTRLTESPEFTASQGNPAQPGVRLAGTLRGHLPGLFSIGGMVVMSAAALYLIFVFMPVYASGTLGLPGRPVQVATLLSATLEVPVILLAAHLADRFGALAVMLPAALAWALASWPLFDWMIVKPSPGHFLVAQLAAAALLGWFSGPMPSYMSSLLPTRVRSTGIGLMFNAVGAVFGGLGPLLITLMIAKTRNPAAPAWWAALTGAVGAATLLLNARARTPLGVHIS
jgi:MFS transporter, MHS family, proline/betaine transporter